MYQNLSEMVSVPRVVWTQPRATIASGLCISSDGLVIVALASKKR
ncbi:hypothetical protein NIES3974_01420 [Calothrix sp. NIES-3974]|nr:hypothetical protein NIES3974_01420 [Calothrix sp. NIES-3974]